MHIVTKISCTWSVAFICSGAILRYLATKYQVPDHWYPSKLEDRAKVDECLEWTDSNLRSGASGYFFNKVMRNPIAS